MNENLDRVLVEKYTEVTYLASRLADLLEEFDSLVIKLAKKGVVLDPKEEAAYMNVLSTAALPQAPKADTRRPQKRSRRGRHRPLGATSWIWISPP